MDHYTTLYSVRYIDVVYCLHTFVYKYYSMIINVSLEHALFPSILFSLPYGYSFHPTFSFSQFSILCSICRYVLSLLHTSLAFCSSFNYLLITLPLFPIPAFTFPCCYSPTLLLAFTFSFPPSSLFLLHFSPCASLPHTIFLYRL